MFNKEKFIIGSRGSRLSLAQAEHFKDELLLANPILRSDQIEIKIIKTSGDKFKTENLVKFHGARSLLPPKYENFHNSQKLSYSLQSWRATSNCRIRKSFSFQLGLRTPA